MAQRTVTLSDGRTLTLEVSDDATQEDIISTVNQFLESEKPKLPELESQPSLGDIGKGLTAEIAIGQGAKLAGLTAGAALGGPIGALIGLGVGAVAGGISGSLTAQRLEGRTDYSWGRVTADTLLNVMDFTGGGKAAKATKLFPKLGKRALTGAGISAGAAQIEKGIEEQELLSPTELLVAGATGGALNIGIGAAGDALGDIYRKKIAGKNVDAVQKAYDEGDADIIALVDAVTKEGDPEGKFDRFMKSISSYALPTKIIGNKASADIRDAMSKSEAAMDLATRARKQIDSVYKDLNAKDKRLVDNYLMGETSELNTFKSKGDGETVPKFNFTKQQSRDFLREIETSTEAIPDIVAKNPQLRKASIENAKSIHGDTVRVYRVYSLPKGKELRPDEIVSTTYSTQAMMGLNNQIPTRFQNMQTFEIEEADRVFRAYDVPVDRVIADIPFLGDSAIKKLNQQKLRGKRNVVTMEDLKDTIDSEGELVVDLRGIKPIKETKFEGRAEEIALNEILLSKEFEGGKKDYAESVEDFLLSDLYPGSYKYFTGRDGKPTRDIKEIISAQDLPENKDYFDAAKKVIQFNKDFDLIDSPEVKKAKSTINSARKKLDEYQDIIIDLYDKGVLDINELTYQKIVNSRKRGDYATTEYQFFLDDAYKPTKQQTQALLNRLTEDARSNFIARAKKRKSKNILEKADELQPQFEKRAADKVRKLLDSRESVEGIYGLPRGILKRKEDKSDEMKDFLGIIEDPGEKLFGTISKLGRLASSIDGDRKLTDRLVNSGIGVVADGQADIDRLLDQNYVKLKIKGKEQNKYGQERVTRAIDKYQDIRSREIYDTIDEALTDGVPRGFLKNIKEESYVRGGNSVYVPREINTAIDLLSRKNFKDDSILWSENLFTQLLSTTTAASKFVKVPLSVAAYPVQFFGNAVMVGGMGMNPFKNYTKNFRIATSDLNTKYFREGGFAKDLTLNRMTRLKELNLIDKGISAGEIREGLSKGFFGKKFGKATEPVGKFYSIFDTAQRLSVFDNYKGFLKKVMPDDQFKNLGNDKIEEIAAELTNSTYQNYSRINPAMRYLSRIGFLNEFAAFNLEQMRTMANQATFIRSLTSGKFANDIKSEYGVDLDREALFKEGNKRIGFLLGMLSGATAAVTAVNRGVQGVSSEEENAIRETVVPTWDEDSKLLLRKDGDKIKTANISYQIPIAELTSIVESALRGENPVDAVGQGFGALWNKMGGSGTMNANNFFAALNNRDPRTGRPISDEPGGLGQFTDRFVYYFGKSFTPTLLGKTQDKTVPDLIARYTIGLRNQNTTIEGGAGFKLRALRDNFNNVRRSYSSDLYRGVDMQDAYQARNAVFQRNLLQVIKHANNLRTLGKTDEYTDKILAKSGLSKKIREAALNNEMINMPFGVGISGTRAEKKERAFELYESLPKDVGLYMLNEARDDGRIKQSTINEIIRQSQFKKLSP